MDASTGKAHLHRRQWHTATAVVAAAGLFATLSACTADPEKTPVEIAQDDVAAKEEALAEAQTAATDAQAQFCTAGSSYITALDRYGDVLDDTETTVGDVRVAGQDLTEPGEETADAADAVVSTRESLADAQQDLTDAQAALAAAEAAEAGQEAPEPAPSEPTVEPTVPPATVTRVQEAQADLDSTREGLSDDTPLAQAAEQFNSAVVALEMAWVQLFVQSGCIPEEQQAQAADAVGGYTVALQQQLTEAGYYTGAVDGIYGPQTVAAVEALQNAAGLPETGTMDKATEAALRAQLEAAGGAAADASLASTAALQQTLKLAGYWDGPVDGLWTDALTAAVGAAQTDLGVPVTGTVDAATVAAFQRAIAEAMEPATPEPTEEAEPEPTPSSTEG
ncbi:peptidoglycan-binding domain-containing protein [Cellulomonas sp. Leaf395]|uniref:peptidoglycan-binding domain-containing protein n=1 Tax=Cellulomonas sp. Leaf395 TaxID=1736362 RepID=UPI000AC9823A|nr:peptidoglycan-binding domain-containing protein [Cellulomonas sp. Leaf395]